MEKNSKSKFSNHEDLHRQTADLWFRELKQQKKRVKKMSPMAINFLMLYGGETI